MLSLSNQIGTAIESAIAHLECVLRLTLQESDTHRVILIDGWNDDQVTRQSVAHYLVGLRVSAINAILQIQAALENTQQDRLEILESVITIIGEDNNLSYDRKSHERNPWIAEGLWHMCMAVAARRRELHPNGNIVALDYAHVITKDHGLDIAAMYERDNIFGLSLVESKAYRDRPNDAINDAVAFFKEVDGGKHSARIRQSVQIMRNALSPDQQSKISASFWKRERTYLPNPHYHYNNNNQINWTNPRPSFRNLKPKCMIFDRSNIIIMPHILVEFDDFFDGISDEMRNFARGLQ
ncbi:MAG: hypothetical protein HY867_09160 [Chloroflexi bacterium]|nr:hypothetical protein [Chloroflexota bacterium]